MRRLSQKENHEKDSPNLTKINRPKLSKIKVQETKNMKNERFDLLLDLGVDLEYHMKSRSSKEMNHKP